jgi:hypothetical protein
LGLTIGDLSHDWEREALAVAPCLAAAHLLMNHLKAESR